MSQRNLFIASDYQIIPFPFLLSPPHSRLFVLHPLTSICLVLFSYLLMSLKMVGYTHATVSL